jgi:hypothetical protein
MKCGRIEIMIHLLVIVACDNDPLAGQKPQARHNDRLAG